jgi:hypothetical protein
MTAQDIVKRLLEDEPLDSLEGVPDYGDWRMKAFNPGTPEHRDYRLRHDKPRNAREAAALGVNWYIKDGRKYTFSMATPEPGGYPRKSHAQATSRNQRRKSFGYRDVYSTRERDWPSGGRDAYYKRQDRAREARKQAAQSEVDRLIGSGI